MFLEELKKYVKHFKVLFIILGVCAVIYGIMYASHLNDEPVMHKASGNTERVYGDQRVFDYADQLSDDEEARLEALIHEIEPAIESDIVIVTLNEPLEFYEIEYRSKYSVAVDPSRWVMVYADKFWEDNKFGFDKPQILDGQPYSGDGVILVDNMYREGPENKIYTWMGTTGKCERAYSSSMIDSALDDFYEEVEYDYYDACVKFVKHVARDLDMDGTFRYAIPANTKVPAVVAVIVTLIYCMVNWHSKAAKVTVNDKTYVIGHRANFDVKEDTFIRKTVSKTKVSSSSSGGGGGHHVSGGGGSHGGGGHSR